MRLREALVGGEGSCPGRGKWKTLLGSEGDGCRRGDWRMLGKDIGRERKEREEGTDHEIVGVVWMRLVSLRLRRHADCKENQDRRCFACLLRKSERNSKDWTPLRSRSELGRKAPGDQHLLEADAGEGQRKRLSA